MLVAALTSTPSRRCVPWQFMPNRPVLNHLIRARRRPHLLVAGGTLIHGGQTEWLDYIEMRADQGVEVPFFGTGIAFSKDQITSAYDPYRRWCKVLRRSKCVYLRGIDSVRQCRQMGASACTFGDFAFLLHQLDRPITRHGERDDVVGINIGECLGDQSKFEAACAAVVKHLGARYRLVFHVVVAKDMVATKRVIERSGLPDNVFRVEEHYFDPHRFMESIRGYRAFLGLKLHAVGLAMIAGVPSVMIAYLPKCLDFLSVFGPAKHVVLDLPLQVDEVLSKMQSAFDAPRAFIFVDKIARIAEAQRRVLQQVFPA